MTPEDIVRRLAAEGFPEDRSGCHAEACAFCGACQRCPDALNSTTPDGHAADCLYRLACEWVAANPPGRATIPEQIEAERVRKGAA